jgi:bacterioferritin
MADEENHIDYRQTRLELMNSLGEQLYLARCVARPPAKGSTAKGSTA